LVFGRNGGLTVEVETAGFFVLSGE